MNMMDVGGPARIARKDFSQYPDAALWAASIDRETLSRHGTRMSRSWYGGTAEEALRAIEHGDVSAAASAERIIDRIDAALGIMGDARTWAHDVAGQYPDIPRFISGDPMCMRSRIYRDTAQSTVTIYAMWGAQSEYSPGDIALRGGAVLAIALAIQRVRPVQLVCATCAGKGDHMVTLRSPIVLSEASPMLASTPVMRHLVFSRLTQDGWEGTAGRWGGWGEDMTQEARIVKMRACLGAEDDDIIVPPLRCNDGRDVLADPVAWCNKILDKYRAR